MFNYFKNIKTPKVLGEIKLNEFLKTNKFLPKIGFFTEKDGIVRIKLFSKYKP